MGWCCTNNSETAEQETSHKQWRPRSLTHLCITRMARLNGDIARCYISLTWNILCRIPNVNLFTFCTVLFLSQLSTGKFYPYLRRRFSAYHCPNASETNLNDVIKFKYFPRQWPFVRGIDWLLTTSPNFIFMTVSVRRDLLIRTRILYSINYFHQALLLWYITYVTSICTVLPIVHTLI